MLPSRRVLTYIQKCVHSTTVLCLLASCTACGSIKAQDNNSKTPLPTIPSPPKKVVASGKLVPQGDVIKISIVNAKDSRVNNILVKEGDKVKANQVIAILQGQKGAEQQILNAQANVAIKKAQLLKIQQGDVKQAEIVAQHAAIDELKAQIRTQSLEKQAVMAQTEATLRNAKIRYKRYMSLKKQGVIKQSELDDGREEFDKLQAILLQNKANLENTKSTLTAQIDKEQANLQRLHEVRPMDVLIAKAELEQAQIQVEQRKAVLDNTQVRVPVAGQILRLNTRVGEQVNTSDGIAELGRTEQMYVLAEVYETDIDRVRLGQRATLTSEYGGFQGDLHGIVDHIGLQIAKNGSNQDQNNPTTDINARVVEVKIRLDPQDSPKVAALSGMRVRVKIFVSSFSGS